MSHARRTSASRYKTSIPTSNKYMFSFHECADISSILDLKNQYLRSLTAPMDGMWEVGFINPVPHWEIRMGDELTGYFAVNDKRHLLQFYLLPGFGKQSPKIFESVLEQHSITCAIVNTIDPAFLSVSLDIQAEVSVHSFVYEHQTKQGAEHPLANGTTFRSVEMSELNHTVSFQQTCLGGEDDLSEWLNGYSANLMDREELFVLCRGEDWIGLGEYRKSDSQEGVVDVGMMVEPGERGKRWATYILSLLVEKSQQFGHHAICSTTVDNVAAQKAILEAGFESRNRILKISF